MATRRFFLFAGAGTLGALAVGGAAASAVGLDRVAAAARRYGLLPPENLKPRDDFNTAEIDWRGPEEGFAAAAAEGKPIFMIVHAEWCPHCKLYRNRFFDPAVVASLKNFVCIEMDRDASPDLAKNYLLDGREYIPRTLVLNADASPREDLKPNPAGPSLYFLPYQHEPALRRFLERARQTLGVA